MTKRNQNPDVVNTSRSNAAKHTQARKKAKERMDRWVDNEQFVTLHTAGVEFVGTLSRLGEDKESYGDFMFKSPFGVNKLLYLLTFNEISFEDIPSMELVHLAHTKEPHRRCTLQPADWMQPSPHILGEVHERLRLWVRMKANVAVHVGDAMRLSAFRCVLTEPNPGTFLFEATEAGTVHIVHTAACHHLEVTRDDDRMLITMFNRKTNTYVMVSDFHESREAVFERFTAITKQIQ